MRPLSEMQRKIYRQEHDNGAIADATNASTKQALQTALAKANSGIAATDLAAAQKDASAAEASLKSAK